MTKDGQKNRWGRFIFEDSQAERVQAGDMSAVWEFIEDNRIFLTRWARKFIRVRFFFMPQDYYDVDEFLNQIYVDFPFYKIEDKKSLYVYIFRSFLGISNGGFLGKNRIRENKEVSFDTRISVSNRSGEQADGDTLRNLLPSREPTPYEVLIHREHIAEIAPLYFAEIGKLCGKNGERFRDIIEEVFFGMSFEEVQKYARKTGF